MPVAVVPVAPGATAMAGFSPVVQVTVIANVAGIGAGPPVALTTDLITFSDPVLDDGSQRSVFVAVRVAAGPAAIVTGAE